GRVLWRELSASSLWLPPSSTLFPYTALFRSHQQRQEVGAASAVLADLVDGLPQRLEDSLRIELDLREVLVDLSGEESLEPRHGPDRKSTRLNSSHVKISYAVFCLKKKKTQTH